MNKTLELAHLVDTDKTSSFQALSKSAFGFLGNELNEAIKTLLQGLGVNDSPVIEGDVHPAAWVEGPVYISAGARVEPSAMIVGPAYIGPGTQVRHGAYIRGDVIAGENSVIGHATEVKGSVFFAGAKAGHFAYVGDSILGNQVNLGAGTKLANLTLEGKSISYKDPETGKRVDSGLRKWGAIIGDRAQTGCNAVLSPGSILFPDTAVLPCSHFKGTLKKGWAKSSQ